MFGIAVFEDIKVKKAAWSMSGILRLRKKNPTIILRYLLIVIRLRLMKIYAKKLNKRETIKQSHEIAAARLNFCCFKFLIKLFFKISYKLPFNLKFPQARFPALSEALSHQVFRTL